MLPPVLTVLGIAMLFPWNAFLKATLYFSLRMTGTPLAHSFPSWVSLCYTGSMVTSMTVLVTMAPEARWLGLRGKIIVGLALNMAVMAGLLLMPAWELITRDSKGSMLDGVVILGLVGVAGVGVSLLQRGVLGMLAQLPPGLTPCLVGGQAVAGLLVSLFSLGSAALGESPQLILTGTVVYFGKALAVLTAALGAFCWAQARNVQMREALAKLGKNDTKQKVSLAMALRRIWRHALGIMLSLTVTIAILAAMVTSAGGRLGRLFIPLAFVAFDLGDLLGRWLPLCPVLAFTPRSSVIWILPMARTLFIVPFATAAVEYPRRWLPAIGPQWLFFVWVFLLGLTNGWGCSLAFMHAPMAACSRGEVGEEEEEGVEREWRGRAGALMGLGLNCGLVLGSLTSFALRPLII